MVGGDVKMSYNREREKNPNWKGGVTFAKCFTCSKDFRSNGKNKFCSMRCYLKNVQKPKEKKRCLFCNKVISFIKNNQEMDYAVYEKRKFCSTRCAYNFFKLHTWLQNKKKCIICDKEYLPKNKNSVCCSNNCRYRYLKGKNKWTEADKKRHSQLLHHQCLEKYKANNYHISIHSYSYRRLAGKKPLLCPKCTKKNKLEVHHIDNDRKNNHPSNLKWLCLTCHKQVHVEERNGRNRKRTGTRL